jgi:hypothetical protein
MKIRFLLTIVCPNPDFGTSRYGIMERNNDQLFAAHEFLPTFTLGNCRKMGIVGYIIKPVFQ